ncbi:hypothetical protein BV898_17230 [Hypsibius exemplaris]|uniref:GB1/RHD3-type G domain-containing protein n=1 Tax=Hypsibius exemplaris TaxID=2072580 RepID=A0A9X6RLU3_HYPEX|nr:hypothetical protein BV898_17230 [Hypsibius exemplaris]
MCLQVYPLLAVVIVGTLAARPHHAGKARTEYAGVQESCWCRSDKQIQGPGTFQIAKISTDGTIQLVNLQRFTNLLTSSEVRSRAVAIVGITGAVRSGKSTLLNLLHRYLSCATSKTDDPSRADSAAWLYEFPHIQPKCGRLFPTSPHQGLCTKGVWITAHPYLTQSGDKAIFLLDTQGLFTNHVNGSAVDSGLFYIASLLSSTLIVNVVNNLDTQLTHFLAALTLRIRKAVSVQENQAGTLPEFGNVKNEGKIFQELHFLIRNYHFQNQTGADYLENYAKTFPDGSLTEVEKNFERVEASLLPTIALNPRKLAFLPGELNPDFESNCNLFFQRHFSPHIIAPKTIFGATLNGLMLATRFQQFEILLRSGQIPPVQDVYQTIQLIIAQEDAEKAFETYEIQAFATISALGPGLSDRQVAELDSDIQRGVLYQRSKRTPYSNDVIEEEFQRLFQAKVKSFMAAQLDKIRQYKEKQKLQDYNLWLEKQAPAKTQDGEGTDEYANIWRFMLQFTAVKALIGLTVTLVSLYLIYSLLVCFCRIRIRVPAPAA